MSKDKLSEKARLSISTSFIRKRFEEIYSGKVTDEVVVYLTAVIDYLMAEILELSGNASRNRSRTEIDFSTDRIIKVVDIRNMLRQDEELGKLFEDFDF